METSKSKVSLKLLIDRNSNKVLFAEAGKDFVDFLFNLLSLPVGTIINLLTKQSMVGSLGNLYDSVENLSETYVQPNQNKDSLLKPDLSYCATNLPLLLPGYESKPKKFYICNSNHSHEFYVSYQSYVSDDPRAVCPNCKQVMSKNATYVAPTLLAKQGTAGGGRGDEGGFVKGVVTYMVMDDLVVKPMSTISSIALLNKFKVKELGALEEKQFDFGMPEGLKLLKASLHSKEVLTNTFLANKVPKRERY